MLSSRYIHRLLVVFCLVLSYFALPKYGFTSFTLQWKEHLLYPLSHANIFHLAANASCLFLLTCKLRMYAAYPIAVAASFLPSFAFIYPSEPTMGFSAVLFAIAGISWGRVGCLKDMLLRNKWFIVLPAFIPHVNALLHIYSLLLGYLYGYIDKRLCDKR